MVNEFIELVDGVIRIKDSSYKTNRNDTVDLCDNILKSIAVALKKELDEELDG